MPAAVEGSLSRRACGRMERFAAAPLIRFRLHGTNADRAVRIRNVMLQCQIRIEATRRFYEAEEQSRLRELFGEPKDWGNTLRSLLWTHVGVNVPAFDQECTVHLPVPCSTTSTSPSPGIYIGVSVEHCAAEQQEQGHLAVGARQLDQISWSKEAEFRLPVRVWQEMMAHYPDGAWLRLSRDLFERIYAYKRERGHLTWEQALASLLDAHRETVP